MRSRTLRGQVAGRPNRSDAVDAAIPFFLNASLDRVLILLLHIWSAVDVLEGIGILGGSPCAGGGLLARPIPSFEPWVNWLLPMNCCSSTRCSPQHSAYQWLRPYLVPPSPFSVCDPSITAHGSGILVEPSIVDAHFRKSWKPFFLREENQVSRRTLFFSSSIMVGCAPYFQRRVLINIVRVAW